MTLWGPYRPPGVGGGVSALAQAHPIEAATATAASVTIGAAGVRATPLVTDGDPFAGQFIATGAATFQLTLSYRMAIANTGVVALRVSARVINPGDDPDGAYTVLGTREFTPGNDTLEHTVTDASWVFDCQEGATVRYQAERITPAGTDHTGNLEVLGPLVKA